MASINSVQQPTKYTAIHSNNGIKEYQDFNFTFVPIPNNEATHDDLEKDISLNNKYYNINDKSFYAEIDTIDHTTPEKLQDSIDNTSLEQVVYAPSSDTTTIIYKVSKGDTEEYKCSKESVKIISFGDDSLMNKGFNASMENVTIHCDDGSQLCSIKNDFDDNANNSVINIKSTGQVKIEIPNGVKVSSAELISDDIYMKGTFTSENTENFFVCKYTKGGEQYCTYTDKIVPNSIISSSGDTSTIQLGNSKVDFTPNKPVYVNFLKVGDDVKTGGLSKDYYEETTEMEDSEYPLYTENNVSYVRINNLWYKLDETNVRYSYNENENKIIISGKNHQGVGFNSKWDNKSYLQYVKYVQKVSVVDSNDSSKNGYYLIKRGNFEEGVNLDKTDSFQQVISGFFDETENAENRFCALDKNFYLVVDTNTNKIIYKDGSATLASLEYNTTSN
jgi:hypothetical protein